MASYRGRFAPSPTGPLHLGSLTAALASYLDAKAHHGQWLVRMEDLDPPREQADAAESILQCLQSHNLHWDETVLYQSQRHTEYQRVIDQLKLTGDAFYCSCSRSQLQRNNLIHDGICSLSPTTEDVAVRLRVSSDRVSFIDSIQGPFSQQLNTDVGDIVLKRKDGFFAYQLAVVIDDEFQRITHCVRGSDLLESTPRQIFLQKKLAYSSIKYSHIPVLNNSQQQKLSKQNHATPLINSQASTNLIYALQYLHQPLPDINHRRESSEILRWAIEHWSPELIPKTLSLCQNNITLCN